MASQLRSTSPRGVVVIAAVLLVGAGSIGGACSGCSDIGQPCADSGDCATGEACVAGGGGSVCALSPSEGEGEGDGGEGEGEGGEGEGECGDGHVDESEACDDGNDDDNDLCNGRCEETVATSEVVLGAWPLRALPLTDALYVWASPPGTPDRGAIVTDIIGAIFFRPPSSDLFFRVDASVPLARDAPSTAASTLVRSPAATPDGRIVFFDDATKKVLSLDPVTHTVLPLVGDGTVEGIPENPTGPGFTFPEGPLGVSVSGTFSLDVDAAGTVFIAGSRRVLALDNDDTLRLVAGAIGTLAGGNEAQAHNFGAVFGVSVDPGPDGVARGVFIAHTTGSDRSVFRADLATGALTEFAGSGSACDDGAPLSGCNVSAFSVAADGAGGFYAGDLNLSRVGGGKGIFHVAGDAAHSVTQVVAPDELAFAFSLAVIEPGVLAVGEELDAKGFLLLHDDGTSGGARERVGRAVMAEAHERTIPSWTGGAAVGTHLYAANAFDLYDIDEDTAAATRVLAAPDDLGPCADNVLDGIYFTGLAASIDGARLYFSQSGANRICELDLATGDVRVVLAGTLDRPERMAAFDATRLVVLSRIGGGGTSVDFVKIQNGDVDGIVGAGNFIDVDSDGTRTRLLQADLVASDIVDGDPPSLATVHAQGTPVEALLVDGADASLVLRSDVARLELFEGPSDAGAVIAGDGTAGFRNGAANTTRFEGSTHDLVRFADGGVALLSDTSIRLLRDGVMSTLAGSDQFTEDGALATARYVAPTSFSCAGAACVALDERTHTVRALDLAAGSLTRAVGVEGAPFAAVSLASIDPTHALFSDGHAIFSVSFPDGAPVVRASAGATVVAPSLVLPVEPDAASFVYVDGNNLREAGAHTAELGTIDDDAGVVSGLAFDPVDHVVFVGKSHGYRAFDLDAGDTPPPEVALDDVDLPFNGLARDSFGNIYFSTFEGVFRIDGDTATRLLHVGDAALLFSGADTACTSGGLAVVDDDVLLADRCTGAVVRIRIE